MLITERSLQEIGKSLLVSVPKSWAKTLHLKKGSTVKIHISEQGTLSIAPEFIEKEKQTESTIPFDEHFSRRFFREYFYGREAVTLFSLKPISVEQKQQLYSFLRKFMNVQIVEELPTKIVVKCFKIDELSIEECLKRMHFLSLNMIDSTLEKQPSSLLELEETATKFYYLLVMQVRRFLEEGKFTKENQIPLIRVLDARMVAERVKRIINLIVMIQPLEKKELLVFLTEIRHFYQQSFQFFMGNAYEKALALYPQKEDLLEKYHSFQQNIKSITLQMQYHHLTRMLSYSTEISMLIR